MARPLAALFILLLLGGCSLFSSGDKAAADAGAAGVSEADKSRLCADPDWKAAHLGLWYNVCTRGTVF